MDDTPRFALPFIAPGQAQKELFHNEALQRIDFLLCPVVEEPPRPAPPATPAVGSAYVVAAGASGAWTGHDGEIAGFGEGGWRFLGAIDGASVIDRVSGEILLRRAAAGKPASFAGRKCGSAGRKWSARGKRRSRRRQEAPRSIPRDARRSPIFSSRCAATA